MKKEVSNKKAIITIIVVIILLVVLAGVYVYLFKNNKNKNPEKKKYSDEIKTVATLEDEITTNSIWCGTFQLVWNDMVNNVVKQDVVFTPQEKLVENLNYVPLHTLLYHILKDLSINIVHNKKY